jgi:hypothetical protein
MELNQPNEALTMDSVATLQGTQLDTAAQMGSLRETRVATCCKELRPQSVPPGPEGMDPPARPGAWTGREKQAGLPGAG